MSKPFVLVTRALFPETIEKLKQHFDVEANQDDVEWSRDELIAKLQGKQGAFTTGSVKIDETLLVEIGRAHV